MLNILKGISNKIINYSYDLNVYNINDDRHVFSFENKTRNTTLYYELSDISTYKKRYHKYVFDESLLNFDTGQGNINVYQLKNSGDTISIIDGELQNIEDYNILNINFPIEYQVLDGGNIDDINGKLDYNGTSGYITYKRDDITYITFNG